MVAFSAISWSGPQLDESYNLADPGGRVSKLDHRSDGALRFRNCAPRYLGRLCLPGGDFTDGRSEFLDRAGGNCHIFHAAVTRLLAFSAWRETVSAALLRPVDVLDFQGLCFCAVHA
jgi:hypothetical protein